MKYRQKSYRITREKFEDGINKIKKRYKHAFVHESGDFTVLVVYRDSWQGLSAATIIFEPIDTSNYTLNIISPIWYGWGIQTRFNEKILYKFSIKPY